MERASQTISVLREAALCLGFGIFIISAAQKLNFIAIDISFFSPVVYYASFEKNKAHGASWNL